MVREKEQYCVCYILDATREFDSAYTYRAGELASQVKVGQIVELPFGRGNGIRRGVIAELTKKAPNLELKEIKRILTPEPLLVAEHFILAEEIRRRYFASRGQALMLMMPQTIWGVGRKQARYARLVDLEDAAICLEQDSLGSVARARVVEYLLYEGEASLEEIRINCNVSQAVLRGLEKKGMISFFKQAVEREFEQEDQLEVKAVELLDPGQDKVLNELLEAHASIQETGSREFLLHGVTGSGKTEVFLRAADRVISDGRSVIILVPEIALTPLMEARVKARFGDSAVILHSRLTATQRYENWRSIASGQKNLVIGARSAIFAPVRNLGLIVVDEEQETSYKSDLSPRYEAREIARIRAYINKSILLLASATPSLESYYRTQIGKSELLELKSRAGKARLPEVKLIDLKSELGLSRSSMITDPLKKAMAEAFERGEQAMLFLNRRGNSHAVICHSCGHILTCSECDVALTEHLNPYQRNQQAEQGGRAKRLICHYCGKLSGLPKLCPVCGSDKLVSRGFGTQKLEQYFQSIFPDYRALRMDFDTTYTRRAYHEILQAFAKGEADCLIGTQMIAKGHDFPKVTVVGIVSADQLLTDHDYRAEERCFQLITQAAGRAGREDRPGQVYVQAFNSDHYAVEAGLNQDYQAFYQRELELRKRFVYPPFGSIASIIYSGLNQRQVSMEAKAGEQRLRAALNSSGWQAEVNLYPAQQAPLAKLKARYRYRIILKSADRLKLTQLLDWEQARKAGAGIYRSFDINPNSML